MGEKKIPLVLGISTVDKIKRVYVPESVLDVLKVKIGDRVAFILGHYVSVEHSGGASDLPNNVRRVGAKRRVYVPPSIMKRLKIDAGSQVLFLHRDGKVTMSRAEDAVKR